MNRHILESTARDRASYALGMTRDLEGHRSARHRQISAAQGNASRGGDPLTEEIRRAREKWSNC